MSIVAVNNLSEMQAAFVLHVLDGNSATVAAKLAGYSNYSQSGTNLLNSPAVMAALHAGVQRAIEQDAAVNLDVLRKIRDNDAAPARVRADIGIKLLSLAGHIAPRTKEDGPQKAISEMTQAELLAYIDRNQAAIERAESELMAKARDITPAAGVSDSVPKRSDAQAKATDYLD